jgi:hypothetical protein
MAIEGIKHWLSERLLATLVGQDNQPPSFYELFGFTATEGTQQAIVLQLSAFYEQTRIQMVMPSYPAFAQTTGDFDLPWTAHQPGDQIDLLSPKKYASRRLFQERIRAVSSVSDADFSFLLRALDNSPDSYAWPDLFEKDSPLLKHEIEMLQGNFAINNPEHNPE